MCQIRRLGEAVRVAGDRKVARMTLGAGDRKHAASITHQSQIWAARNTRRRKLPTFPCDSSHHPIHRYHQAAVLTTNRPIRMLTSTTVCGLTFQAAWTKRTKVTQNTTCATATAKQLITSMTLSNKATNICLTSRCVHLT